MDKEQKEAQLSKLADELTRLRDHCGEMEAKFGDTNPPHPAVIFARNALVEAQKAFNEAAADL